MKGMQGRHGCIWLLFAAQAWWELGFLKLGLWAVSFVHGLATDNRVGSGVYHRRDNVTNGGEAAVCWRRQEQMLEMRIRARKLIAGHRAEGAQGRNERMAISFAVTA